MEAKAISMISKIIFFSIYDRQIKREKTGKSHNKRHKKFIYVYILICMDKGGLQKLDCILAVCDE